MRFFKILSVSVCLLALCSIAAAKDNKLGIRDVRHISFEQAVRVGETVIPAGNYIVRTHHGRRRARHGFPEGTHERPGEGEMHSGCAAAQG